MAWASRSEHPAPMPDCRPRLPPSRQAGGIRPVCGQGSTGSSPPESSAAQTSVHQERESPDHRPEGIWAITTQRDLQKSAAGREGRPDPAEPRGYRETAISARQPPGRQSATFPRRRRPKYAKAHVRRSAHGALRTVLKVSSESASRGEGDKL